jgi:hypothetical protein
MPDADRLSGREALTPLGARVLRVLVGIAVATWAITTVAHVADLVLWQRAVLLFDVESAQSVAGWASSTVLALAAAASGLLALVRRPRWTWIVLAAVFALLSADDDIGIFDQVLRHRLPSRPDPDVVIWLVSFGPLMGAAFLLLGRWARTIPAPLRRTVTWGLGLLVLAIVGELLVTVVDVPALTTGMPLYELEVTIEEGFELLGVALLAAALFTALVEAVVRARDA